MNLRLKARRAPIALALILLSAAQVAVAEPLGAPFDRKAVVDDALAHNPDLQAAKAQLSAAQSHRRQANAYPNPMLSGQIVGFNPNNQSQLQVQLGVTQTFQLTRQMDHKRDMADLDVASAERQLEVVKEATVLNVKQAYNQTLSARHALELAHENVRWNQQLAGIAMDKVKLGELAAVEGVRASVAVGQAQQDELSSQQAYDSSLTQLRVAMGRMEPIALKPDQGFDVALLSLPPLDQLIRQGLAHRPEVALAAANLQHEVLNERLIRSTILPGFDFTMGGGTNGGGPNTAVPGANVGIYIGLPLWYRQEGELAQSQATQQALQYTRQSTENTLRAQIEQAYGQVRTAESQIHLYQTHLLPDARRLLDQTRSRYLYGDASGRELQEARKTLRETETAYTRAYLDYRNAIANLEASIGHDLPLPNE